MSTESNILGDIDFATISMTFAVAKSRKVVGRELVLDFTT